jgi:hypothetical protein
LPIEFFGDLVDVLGSDLEAVLALRLAIPRLPCWSMKAFFSNIRITLAAEMAPSVLERLAFLAALPPTWFVWIDITYEAQKAMLDPEALPHARKLMRSEAKGIICPSSWELSFCAAGRSGDMRRDFRRCTCFWSEAGRRTQIAGCIASECMCDSVCQL